MDTSKIIVFFLLAAVIAGCSANKASVRKDPSQLYLKAADGGFVTVSELANGRDATVLVFWSSTCPCVRRYQERVDSLLDRYPADRVRVIGISSNAGETFEKVLKTAGDRGVRIPIYRDEGGFVAKSMGAQSTPTVVVIDKAGNILFFGWLDNEHLPGDSSRKPWLDLAIEGILNGRRDFSARTPTYGCTITKSVFGSPEPVHSCSHCQSH